MTYKVIHVGTGGHGENWCRSYFAPHIASGRLEVVAAVDTNPAALVNAREGLGLSPEKCYTDIAKAFDENPADFCTIVVPPAFHEQVADVALAHGMHILSEKPIADSLVASARIARKVKQAGKKMGVTMSHRYDQDKASLRAVLRSGECGTLDYLSARFTCDCRKFASWGKFRHEIPDPLMVEGAVHQLDILADLAGAKCETIYAETWNPKWGEYAGDSQGLVIMHFANGVRCVYEGAKSNAVGLNVWQHDYIKAECEKATIILNRRKLERFSYDPSTQYRFTSEGQGEQIPLVEGHDWGNPWLLEQFMDWLDGGPAMETNVEDNLQSVALIFAAIESSRTGMPVNVQEFLAKAKAEAEHS